MDYTITHDQKEQMRGDLQLIREIVESGAPPSESELSRAGAMLAIHIEVLDGLPEAKGQRRGSF